jgi:hypothetical protein
MNVWQAVSNAVRTSASTAASEVSAIVASRRWRGLNFSASAKLCGGGGAQ